MRSEYKRRSVCGKYPKQRFVPEYKQLYPWIIEDELDKFFAFCVVCETRLSCKRGDLAKHESSNKHRTNAAKKGLSAPENMKEFRNQVNGEIIQCVDPEEMIEDYVFGSEEDEVQFIK